MMTFAPTKTQPYKCGTCGVWYQPQRGPFTIACAVMHAPGTCCHYGEAKAEPPCEMCEKPFSHSEVAEGDRIVNEAGAFHVACYDAWRMFNPPPAPSPEK